MRKRQGFSVFQLLALMALLGLLAAFSMQLIARARTMAIEAKSTNNLKQIGLELYNYNDSFNQLPAGNDKNNFSVAARLLPFVEQDALYKTIDFDKPCDDKANAEARKATIKTFLSPNDPLERVIDEAGATNYLFNAGTATSLTANNGLFYQDSKATIQGIADGSSNTVMAVETLKGDGGKKAMDVRRQHISYKAAELKNLKDESGVDDFKDNKNVVADRGASWIDGRFLQGTLNGGRKWNDERPDVNCGGEGGLSGPRSLGDRIPVLFGDGSVRIANGKKLNEDTWRAILTRAGGEVVNLDF